MAASPVGRTAALLLLLLAAVSFLHTGVAAAKCGAQPTAVFVQKGEKRMISFWHRPEAVPAPQDVEPGSGDGPDPSPAEEVELEQETAAPQPTAATAVDAMTPLIVFAGLPEEGTPTPLYDQQPHIILPEAPPPPAEATEAPTEAPLLPVDGGASGALAAAAGTEPGWWEVPAKVGAEEGAVNVEKVKQSSSEAVSTDESEPQTSQDADETSDIFSSQQTPMLDGTDDSNAEDDKADGSGSIFFDGDDILTVPSPPSPSSGDATGALATAAGTEPGWWEVPAKMGAEEGAVNVEKVKQSSSEAVGADESEPQTSQDAGETSDIISSQQTPVLDGTDDSNAEDDDKADDDKADGSGFILFDGDDIFTVPSSDADSLAEVSETFSFALEGSGELAADAITNAIQDSSTIILDDNDSLAPAGETIAVSVEGSGSIAMDPALDTVEGSGAEPVAVPDVSSEGAEAAPVSLPAALVTPSDDVLSALVDRIHSLVVSDPLEWDGLDTDELLPLVETHSPLLAGDYTSDGDLEVSASEPVAVVVAAPPAVAALNAADSEAETEAEKERLLVVKGLEEDRVILEDVADPEETGSGAGPEMEPEEAAAAAGVAGSTSSGQTGSEVGGADTAGASSDDVAFDGSGMSESEENRQGMESDIIKAVVDVMSLMTDIHGLGGKEEVIESREENIENKRYRPSVYRYVDAHNKPNHVAPPVRPVWNGYHGHEASSRFPVASSRPQRPYHRPAPPSSRPGPVWERLRHRQGPHFRGGHGSARPDPGHVYFPGQFRRGGRPDERRAIFRPPGGSTYASRVGAPSPPLPGYVRRGPSPSGYGRPFKFNAKRSIRRQDDHLLRFLQSQPYPFVSALTGDGQEPRRVRRSRAAPVDCEWQIETEPHLYLLVTLHNLSAPLTIDCSGAYIEVERENDGFEARWCGDRVRKEGTRPHMVFARGEVRIAVHSGQQTGLPTGFDAEVEVIDLLDGGQYVKFRRSGLNFRRLIQEPLLPVT